MTKHVTEYNIFIKHTYFTKETILATSQKIAEWKANDMFENGELTTGREISDMADTVIDSVEEVT